MHGQGEVFRKLRFSNNRISDNRGWTVYWRKQEPRHLPKQKSGGDQIQRSGQVAKAEHAWEGQHSLAWD